MTNKCFLAALLLSTLLSGCQSMEAKQVKAQEVNLKSPDYAFPQQSNEKVFVFVHGIFGDAVDTWTSSNGKRYFDLMRDDAVFKDADFYVYGFPSYYWRSSFTIDQAATDLANHLQNSGVLNYKQIVFICHSMGGLVVERYLLRHRSVSKKVPLMFLYSTPQEGAAIAMVAQYVSNNLAIDTMIPGDKDQYLIGLDGDWKEAQRQNEISTRLRCAYETKPTFGFKIVSYFSGTRFCEGESSPIDSDHIDIVKPDKPSSGSYVAFRSAYQTVVYGLPSKGAGVFLEKAAENHQITIQPADKNKTLDRASLAGPLIKGSRVLWVDDNPGNNDAERNALGEIGIHADIAVSTADALNRMSKKTYDLVISDMKRGNEKFAGLDLLQQMKEKKYTAQVIFYTLRYDTSVMGTPPSSFGITNRPDELFNLVLDALELKVPPKLSPGVSSPQFETAPKENFLAQ